MAKRRRSPRKQKPALPPAAEVVGFTEAEEAFFSEAAEIEVPVAADDEPRPSFWRRLFTRSQSS